MLITIGATIFFVFALAAIGFGVYEILHGQVTNGLLSFILSAITLNLTINWMRAFEN